MSDNPRIWTPERKEEALCRIMQELSTTKNGINAICKADGLPSIVTFYEWMKDEEVANRYARAKEAQAHLLAEEVIQIADDDSLDIGFTEDGKPFVDHENIARSRLRVDSRKWLAGKLAPKTYGDKLDVTSKDKELKGTVIVVANAEDKELLEKL